MSPWTFALAMGAWLLLCVGLAGLIAYGVSRDNRYR